MTWAFFPPLPVEVFSAESCIPQATVTSVAANTGLGHRGPIGDGKLFGLGFLGLVFPSLVLLEPGDLRWETGQ